jgi:hypothetical protein
MEASLTILATLAAYATDSLRPHLAQLHPILGACLGHASLEVQARPAAPPKPAARLRALPCWRA